MTVKGIRIRNIYYMLAYAFKALRESVYSHVEVEEFENAEDLFGEILSIGIARILKRGLHRMYEERTEDLPSLRGKVELTESIRHRLNHRQLISSTHDEFSVNNPFNQILKSTAVALAKTGKLAKSGAGLKRVMPFMNEVDVIPLRQIRWGCLRYERNNQHYQMLMNVCRFVIDGLLMSEGKSNGKNKIRSFEMDEQKMSDLYESFLCGYYAVKHPRLHASPRQINWAVPEGTDKTQLPLMKTDITLTDGVKTLILDAKFYGSIMQENYDKFSYRNAHINQVLVYALNEYENTGKEVRAMLLYAKTGELSPCPGMWKICGHEIGIDIIDLAQPFTDIANQLDCIVSSYFGLPPRSGCKGRQGA